MSLQKIPDGPLRSGYTTGACATACTKAALLALILQEKIIESTITLPLGQIVTFKIHSCNFNLNEAICSTIKDAGDDPDVTHGAEIGCKISWREDAAIQFNRGEGVGIVTLPGLQIAVGEPAINPVPRKMMLTEVNYILKEYYKEKGVNIEVFVVNGKQLALKTLNSRIGILDGISILGTTGIVKPFSASAYIASITQGIDVAIANGCSELIINSGGRTENILRKIFSNVPEYGFIQYGNWIGETLEKIKTSDIQNITMGIMLGKAVKLAQGNLNTHSGQSIWDKKFIFQMAIESGYSPQQCNPILDLSMARRLTEIFPFKASELFYKNLINYCYKVCKQQLLDKNLNLILFDANDKFIVYSGNDLGK